MSKSPENRYQTADEIVKDLKEIEKSEALSKSKIEQPKTDLNSNITRTKSLYSIRKYTIKIPRIQLKSSLLSL